MIQKLLMPRDLTVGGEVASLTHSFGVNPLTQDHELWSQETRNIALSCGAKCVSISWTA